MKWKGHRFVQLKGIVYLAWRDQDLGLYWAIPADDLPEYVRLNAAKTLHPWRMPLNWRHPSGQIGMHAYVGGKRNPALSKAERARNKLTRELRSC